ncbi:hypothetical protein EZV62_026159 [Acer yangbiense]|uniref:Uncharacterized protein n=1 Tax=Acer yangbiense TaxID=1000413 RepID=A0A5C7GQP5_9ROSI|nr:hypothetical protein EZV62_026159 [Acer yangbiense]
MTSSLPPHSTGIEIKFEAKSSSFETSPGLFHIGYTDIPVIQELYHCRLDQKKEQEEQEQERGIPLFAAIRTGNTKFVKFILTKYRRALELVNHRKQNILHVPAMYRRKEIFDFVKGKDIPMIRLARQIDVNGYTVLHSTVLQTQSITKEELAQVLPINCKRVWRK